LAKQDEISSTEKLLELIRADAPQDSPPAEPEPPAKTRPRGRAFLRGSVSFRKKIAIGVDIGPNELKLVKVNRASEDKLEVLAFERVALDPAHPKDGPTFDKYLKSTLGLFCGPLKAPEIWCTMSSARVDLRLIRIPKVASKQIATSVFWSFQKESPFDEKEKIFDFELLGDVDDKGVTKIEVMAYSVPLQEVKDLRDQFARAGFPLTGISIVPFAYQTLLRAGQIEPKEGNVASLYIGRDWSRIDIFSKGTLILSRGIKAGVKTMIEAIRKEIEGGRRELSLAPASPEGGRVRIVKRRLEVDLDQAQQIFFGVQPESSQAPMNQQLIADQEENIFQMTLPALERLVRQVERTIKHYALTHENAQVGKIFISSAVRPNERIVEFISKELGLPTETMNPFSENLHLVTAVPVPQTAEAQSSYAPAMGMALARNEITPNFLFTYKDKQRAARSQRINQAIFSFFLVALAVCVGISFWQKRLLEQEDRQRAALQSQLESYSLRVDKGLIMKLLDEYRESNRSIQSLAEKYLSLAVISEITKLTPSSVRLLNIDARLGSPVEKPAKKDDKKDDKKDKKKVQPQKILVVDGIIMGDRLTLESSLAGYIMSLRNSPLFDQPTINKKSFEIFQSQEVLRFSAQLVLG
jgi:Tfp pilus assembly PilM family ATPase/uncharacterized membrane-anchored protein YhcB (DUF1043 family)